MVMVVLKQSLAGNQKKVTEEMIERRRMDEEMKGKP